MAGLGIYHYGARFYSPKLGRFLSANTIVPNPFHPQDYNRFAYVRNNPVRYVDPSGHAYCDYIDNTNREDCQGGLARSQSTSVIWGNKSKPNLPGGGGGGSGGGNGGSGGGEGGVVTDNNNGLQCPTSSPNCGYAVESCGQGVLVDCPAAPISVDTSGLPQPVILNPLSSNVVSKTTIFDYSYYPPKPIGYTVTFYDKDGNFQINPYEVGGMVADEAVAQAIKYFVIEPAKKQLAGLGITFAACMECGLLYGAYQVITNINDINNAITIESYLETVTIYYSPLVKYPFYIPEINRQNQAF